jgi:hypothetical protein
MCDQDQWDIHKLDPFYQCSVPAQPQPPTIRAKVLSAPSFAWSSTSSRSSTFVESSQKRRRFSTSPSSLEEDIDHSPKKRRHVVHVVDSESDEVEAPTTSNSSAAGQTSWTHVPGRRVRERRGGMTRIPIATKTRINVQDATPQVPPDEDMRSISPPRTPRHTTAPPSTSKRRKGTTCFHHVSPTLTRVSLGEKAEVSRQLRWMTTLLLNPQNGRAHAHLNRFVAGRLPERKSVSVHGQRSICAE